MIRTNLLSEAEKKAEVAKQIDRQVERLRTAAFQKVEKAFLSNAFPEKWLEEGNHILTLAIMESAYKDAALDFKRFPKPVTKDIKNLHLFL